MQSQDRDNALSNTLPLSSCGAEFFGGQFGLSSKFFDLLFFVSDKWARIHCCCCHLLQLCIDITSSYKCHNEPVDSLGLATFTCSPALACVAI